MFLNTAQLRPSEEREENPCIHGREGGRREKTKLNEALPLSHKEEVAPVWLQVFNFSYHIICVWTQFSSGTSHDLAQSIIPCLSQAVYKFFWFIFENEEL